MAAGPRAGVQRGELAVVAMHGPSLRSTFAATVTYPKPLFDFSERRKVCINAMKTEYEVEFPGDDAEDLDRSWRDLFPSGEDAEMQGELSSDEGEHVYSEDEEAQHAG